MGCSELVDAVNQRPYDWPSKYDDDDNDDDDNDSAGGVYTVDILYGPTKVCGTIKHRTGRIEHVKGEIRLGLW